MSRNLEKDIENDPLEENCYNCDDYIKINKRARCGDKHNMGKMKKEGYPCFSRHFHARGYSSGPRDEFS